MTRAGYPRDRRILKRFNQPALDGSEIEDQTRHPPIASLEPADCKITSRPVETIGNYIDGLPAVDRRLR